MAKGLVEVTSFKYLGATLYKDSTCSAEVRIRIASAMAIMARLKGIWRCNTITFASKFKLCKSLVTSPSSSTALKHGPCLLTLRRRFRPVELLRISYLEHKTNDWEQSRINFLVGPQEPVLATIQRRKLARLGHVWRVGDTEVGRRKAGWRTSTSGHPA